MKLRDTLAILCMALLTAFAGAQTAPPVINYQGRLTQSTGVVVPDGLTGMRVRIFATASGGTALWDSGDLSVATKSGTFSILLGSGGMLAMSPLVFALGTVYIEVQPFGQGPLLPRQPIASVPWSLYAQTVSDGAITTPKLMDNATTSAKLASDSASLAKVSGGALAASNGNHIQLGLGPTYDQFMMVIKGNTSGNTAIPGIYVWNEGGQAILDLAGNNGPNGHGAAIGFYDTGPGSGERSWELGLNSAGDLYTHNPSGDKVFFKYNGRVGIGTSDPQGLLDVNGIVNIMGGVSGAPVTALNVNGTVTAKGIFLDPPGALDFQAQTVGFRIQSNIDNLLIKNYSSGSVLCGISADGRFSIGNQVNLGNNLEVAGSAFKPGGGSWSVLSDARLKRDITSIPDPLTQLLHLHGRQFEYKNPAAIHEREGRLFGFIAQEVEKAFPGWVGSDRAGYKNVTIPSDFSALTVEAIRELRSENLALKVELAKERAARIQMDRRLNELSALVREGRK